MPESRTTHPPGNRSRHNVYQALAVLVCALLGAAMILNNQMGGEAMWFWYTSLFHHGVKLYADLHTPLQPLFVLLSDAWMRVFGQKCLVTEIPSLLQVLAMCLGIYLVLRESEWPDWQKAIVLAGAFVTTVVGSSYRFDDYHVVAENFILYSFVLLLQLAKDVGTRRQVLLTLGLGSLCGLTITTRLTDGAALLVAAGICLFVLGRRRKFLLVGLYVLTAAAVVVVIVKLTGDTFADYLSSTLIKAAGSKGGTGSIFAAPFLFFRNALELMRTSGKSLLVWVFAVIAIGALIQRFWHRGIRYIVAVQLGIACLSFLLSSRLHREQMLTGSFVSVVTLFLTVLTYALAPAVAARFALARFGAGRQTWDQREILLLLPLAEWASYSAGAAAEPHTGYYAPVAMLLLLCAVLLPFRARTAWVHASFVTVLALLAFTGTTAKIHNPYSWQNYSSSPMFRNREWYRHPLFGPLYIDRDLLQFSTSVCAEIGQGHGRPELLSLPYPYPNWFCDTPPWHGYVQTFFDTSTRATINHLMDELETAPPQWIIYQRQLHILSGAERLYNHGQPLAQRDLDHLIMQKIATGQWKLVDKKDYLVGDGWFIIRTRP